MHVDAVALMKLITSPPSSEVSKKETNTSKMFAIKKCISSTQNGELHCICIMNSMLSDYTSNKGVLLFCVGSTEG